MEVQTDPAASPPLPETKKRGGFRPGAGRPTTKDPKAPKGEPFILPRIKRTHGTHQFADFVKWWHLLTEEQLDKLIVYVYRSFPVCDIKQVDPDADMNLEKITGPCPFTEEGWRNEIMGKFGSGSYTFMVKEGPVQRWTIYAADLRDFNNFPPLIDYKSLMMSDPANKDFIKWARTRNLIATPDAERGEDVAAMTELVTRALDHSERMSERLMDAQVDLAQKNANSNETPGGRAEIRGMELMQEGATKTIDFMREQMGAMSKSQTTNPMDVVREVVSLVGTLNKPDTSGNAVVDMMKGIIDDQRTQMAELRQLVYAKHDKRDDDDEERPKGLIGKLQERLEARMLDELEGKKSSAAEDGEESAAGKAAKGGVLNMIIEGAMRNLPALIGQGGLNGLAEKLINGVIIMRSTPQTSAPGAPAHIQQLPQQTAAQQAQPVDPQVEFIKALSDPILHHLTSEGLDGHTFARWFIDSNRAGRQNYKLLKAAGPEQLKAALQMYQPLWDVLSKMPAELDQFAGEFMELDEWEKKQAEEDDEDEGGTAGA